MEYFLLLIFMVITYNAMRNIANFLMSFTKSASRGKSLFIEISVYSILTIMWCSAITIASYITK